MEDLNKTQIVLLSVLISFVTSIATGIMTVSLLQEAPIEITRNINRIVEKTIETVTPAAAVVATVPEKQVTTVVVKEEDQIIDSINKNVNSIVRIEEKDEVEGKTSLYGLALVVSKDGLVVATRKTINSSSTYTAIMSDGTRFPLIPQKKDLQTSFVLFKAGDKPVEKSGDENKNITPYVFIPAKFSDSEPKLGQSLISIGGDVTNAVSIGRTISLSTKDSTVGSTTTKVLSSIETDLNTKDIMSGSPLFNLSGDVIGIKTSGETSKSFSPVSLLKRELVILSEAEKTE